VKHAVMRLLRGLEFKVRKETDTISSDNNQGKYWTIM